MGAGLGNALEGGGRGLAQGFDQGFRRAQRDKQLAQQKEAQDKSLSLQERALKAQEEHRRTQMILDQIKTDMELEKQYATEEHRGKVLDLQGREFENAAAHRKRMSDLKEQEVTDNYELSVEQLTGQQERDSIRRMTEDRRRKEERGFQVADRETETKRQRERDDREYERKKGLARERREFEERLEKDRRAHDLVKTKVDQKGRLGHTLLNALAGQESQFGAMLTTLNQNLMERVNIGEIQPADMDRYIEGALRVQNRTRDRLTALYLADPSGNSADAEAGALHSKLEDLLGRLRSDDKNAPDEVLLGRALEELGKIGQTGGLGPGAASDVRRQREAMGLGSQPGSSENSQASVVAPPENAEEFKRRVMSGGMTKATLFNRALQDQGADQGGVVDFMNDELREAGSLERIGMEPVGGGVVELPDPEWLANALNERYEGLDGTARGFDGETGFNRLEGLRRDLKEMARSVGQGVFTDAPMTNATMMPFNPALSNVYAKLASGDKDTMRRIQDWRDEWYPAVQVLNKDLMARYIVDDAPNILFGQGLKTRKKGLKGLKGLKPKKFPAGLGR